MGSHNAGLLPWRQCSPTPCSGGNRHVWHTTRSAAAANSQTALTAPLPRCPAVARTNIVQHSRLQPAPTLPATHLHTAVGLQIVLMKSTFVIVDPAQHWSLTRDTYSLLFTSVQSLHPDLPLITMMIGAPLLFLASFLASPAAAQAQENPEYVDSKCFA